MNLPASLARLRIPRRQGFLFLLAILVPCLLLVALSLRMLVQERELSDKRVADERHRRVGQSRQHLLTHLERVKLEALSKRITANGTPDHTTSGRADGTNEKSAALALIAPIDHRRLLLPWDRSAAAEDLTSVPGAQAFAEAIRHGEHDELVDQRFDAAAVAYRRAFVIATAPAQRAQTQLALARALWKIGQVREATDLSRGLLQYSPSLVDDQGIPFGLYAMRRLLDGAEPATADADQVLGFLRATLIVDPPLPPAALYMAGELADRLSTRAEPALRATIGELRRTLAERTLDLEQAQALQNAWPALWPPSAITSMRAEPIWVPFGPEERLWLVSVTPSLDAASELMIAVRAAPMLAEFDDSADRAESNGTLRLNPSPDGELLGRNFPGLTLVLPPLDTAELARQGSLQRTFYFGALLLVLSVALCGGYFFWRDVQRDLRLAAMRSQFVSSVSHELKTPLTAIRMFAETLRLGRSVNQRDRDEYLDTIVNESERLTRLLNNVLDFSKIEQDGKTYQFESHSLAAVVRSAAKTMNYPLSQQGFALHVEIDENLPAVAMDADALERAILNLLSNAMKYSGNGRVIDLHFSRDAGNAVIAVTDRGCGIAISEQIRIFQKFYRMSEHQAIPGTGLGLTLVQHTAHAHGGHVVVRSAPGEGSTFSIVLPLGPASASLQPEIHNLQSQET